MKKHLFLFAMLCFTVETFAQLNMTALEEPQSQLGSLQVLGKSDFDVDRYFMPADSIHFNNQHYYFDIKHNPIGKIFYVTPNFDVLNPPKNGFEKVIAFYVNHDSKTKGYKLFMSDYYEVIGCIRFKDQFDKHMETMVTYQIVENEDIFQDFAQIFEKDISYVDLPLIADYERSVLISKNSNYNGQPILLLQSKNGDVFYIKDTSNEFHGKETVKVPYYNILGNPVEKKATYKVEEDWGKVFVTAKIEPNNPTQSNITFVSVPFYEQLCNDIKGQEVLLVSQEEFMQDARTNVPFKSIHTDDPLRRNIKYNSNTIEISYPEIKYCKCLNIYVSGGEVFGQFEYEGARFTLAIPHLLEYFNTSLIEDDPINGGFRFRRNYLPGNIYGKGKLWSENVFRDKQRWGKDYYDYDYYIVSRKKVEEIRKAELEEFLLVTKSKEQQRLAREKQRAEKNARYEREEQEYRASLVATYGEEYGNLIADRKVAIGMTEEMCLKAWGRPHDKYNTTTKWGVSSVWVYNYKTSLYFYNGELKQIDN